MPDPDSRILAVQLKRIGDAILTAPALAELRRRRPAAEITLVLAGPAGGLAPAFTAPDEVLVYRRGRANLGVWARATATPFDATYDFTGTDRSALLAWLSGAAERAGFAKFAGSGWRRRAFTRLCDASVRDLHTVDFQRALLGEAPQPEAKPDPGSDTGFRPPALDPGVELPPAYAVVHPGTARTEKYWFADRWARVAAHLHETAGIPVVLTGSDDPEERRHLASLRRACRVPVIDLAGRLTLLEAASLIAGSRITLAVDSAATHLAAMARVPQVALFGPTNPFHWRPRHDGALVVRAGRQDPLGEADFAARAPGRPMRDLSTTSVIRAIDTLLAR